MNTKFILDNYKRDEDLQGIQKILESLKQNPPLLNKKANLLKKFTLASINTFAQKYHPEIKDFRIDLDEKKLISLKAPEKLKLNLDLFNVPEKIEVPLKLFLQAPEKLSVPKKLLENTPSKDLFETAPEKD